MEGLLSRGPTPSSFLLLSLQFTTTLPIFSWYVHDTFPVLSWYIINTLQIFFRCCPVRLMIPSQLLLVTFACFCDFCIIFLDCVGLAWSCMKCWNFFHNIYVYLCFMPLLNQATGHSHFHILCYMELREGDVAENQNIRSSRGAAEYSLTFEMVHISIWIVYTNEPLMVFPGPIVKVCLK